MGMPTDIGIVDLGMGFPYRSIEQKKAAYDFFKANLKDRESLEEMEFPAQYMFKDVPDVVGPDVDPVQWIVEKMDAFNIEQCMIGLNDDSIRAKAEHPGRFHLCASADPNKGMDTVRQLKRQKDEHDIVAAMTFPSGMVPQVGIDDKKMYPIYAKCCELDIPICINGGIVGPRMPSWPQHVEHFDEVCYDFPELTMRDDARRRAVDRARGEAHAQVAGPALHDERVRPEALPEGHHQVRQHAGAPTRSCTAATSRPASALERQFTDMPNVPFKDEVWPKFLRENALRVFKLDQDQ